MMYTTIHTTEKKSKPGGSFIWMLLPLVTFLLITVAIMVERVGFKSQGEQSELARLPAFKETDKIPLQKPGGSCLIITEDDSTEAMGVDNSFSELLLSAKIGCDSVPASQLNAKNIENYDQFIITIYDLDLIRDHINQIFDEVAKGGGILFTIRPDPNLTFQAIYRKLGITSKADRLSKTIGIEFERELLIGGKNALTDFSFFDHSSIPVELDDSAEIYVRSADQYRLPLIWKYNFEQGQVVVVNSDQFTRPESAGILFASFGLLQEYFLYPIINSFTYYLDQFPGPLTSAQNEGIMDEFGRDNKSFFINVWWPDVINAGNKYDVKFTGLMVQSFTDDPKLPFQQEGDEEDYEFLSSSLIHNHGEVGLLGYSLLPYCPALVTNDTASLENLGIFSSLAFAEYISSSSDQLVSTLAPADSANCNDVNELTQVSNKLENLIIRDDQQVDAIIPGYYFQEKESGMVTLPMENFGYSLSDAEIWRKLNLATTKFATVGSINPYDLLHQESSSWTDLRSDFEDQLLWIRSTYPEMRSRTASEAAKATQRYSRIDYQYNLEGNSLLISTKNFYDESWFILNIGSTPTSITGGEMQQIGENRYLLKITEPVMSIELEDQP